MQLKKIYAAYNVQPINDN